ncbi:MAG: hypothetical protein MAG715_00660 [Methanonatronarchaeales archaeon]|nr:hypothetical protein [Methanonatronarchaeales archaeon]
MEHSLLSEENEVEDRLVEMLDELGSGEDVDTSEFWSIVERVKEDPELRGDLANLVGEVDGALFKKSSLLRLPLLLGNVLELALASAGLALLYLALVPADVPPVAGFSQAAVRGATFVVAQFALAAAVHPLAHQVVGRLNGIRFSFYFLNGPARIEPTVKTNYATYLKASPRGRARMHASGAVATNLASLAVLLVGIVAEAPSWATVVMAAVFLLGALNEVVPAVLARFGRAEMFDMRRTDTYRYLREKRYR